MHGEDAGESTSESDSESAGGFAGEDPDDPPVGEPDAETGDESDAEAGDDSDAVAGDESDAEAGDDSDVDVGDESAAVSDAEADGATDAESDGELGSAKRSAISDELDVPDHPPDPATASHVLPDADLVYPTFPFDEGTMDHDGGFDLECELDREGIREWLADLRGGLASHDVGIESPGGVAIFGVGAGDVSVSFDPDGDGRGRLEVTISLDAKLMTHSRDADVRQAGARGDEGFIPIDMLTDDRDPASYRCYNWIDDPLRDGE